MFAGSQAGFVLQSLLFTLITLMRVNGCEFSSRRDLLHMLTQYHDYPLNTVPCTHYAGSISPSTVCVHTLCYSFFHHRIRVSDIFTQLTFLKGCEVFPHNGASPEVFFCTKPAQFTHKLTQLRTLPSPARVRTRPPVVRTLGTVKSRVVGLESSHYLLLCYE